MCRFVWLYKVFGNSRFEFRQESPLTDYIIYKPPDSQSAVELFFPCSFGPHYVASDTKQTTN